MRWRLLTAEFRPGVLARSRQIDGAAFCGKPSAGRQPRKGVYCQLQEGRS
jgi:hypothetical protein